MPPDALLDAIRHEGDEVRETHISRVLLRGDRVYKLKKPVDLGFLDYTTLARRRFFCEEEVRLNRRLAPDVYLGVAPITRHDGRFEIDGEGSAVEWVVVMRRLADADTFLARLPTLDADAFSRLGRHIAAFHQGARGGREVARHARADAVAASARQNFAQTEPHIGDTVSAAVHARLAALTEAWLAEHAGLLDARAARGLPREGHGDLRLEHVYLEGDRLIVLDAVEFSEGLRCLDPVSDVGFLYMDAACRGRRDLAEAFFAAWSEATGDDEARALLPFFAAYRSIVRAKVAGFKVADLRGAAREAMRARARRHWLYALTELEVAARRPCLVGVGGLPGIGKSTLAAALPDFTVIRSDVVRKALAGLAPDQGAAAAPDTGLYTPDQRDRVYAACLDQAEDALFEGRRVVVDASFGRARWRQALVDRARALGVPPLLVVCEAAPSVVRQRLARRRGDASDADWAIHRAEAARWEASPPAVQAVTCVVDTADAVEVATERVLDALDVATAPPASARSARCA